MLLNANNGQIHFFPRIMRDTIMLPFVVLYILLCYSVLKYSSCKYLTTTDKQFLEVTSEKWHAVGKKNRMTPTPWCKLVNKQYFKYCSSPIRRPIATRPGEMQMRCGIFQFDKKSSRTMLSELIHIVYNVYDIGQLQPRTSSTPLSCLPTQPVKHC